MSKRVKKAEGMQEQGGPEIESDPKTAVDADAKPASDEKTELDAASDPPGVAASDSQAEADPTAEPTSDEKPEKDAEADTETDAKTAKEGSRIVEPAKVTRVGTLVRKLLEEAKNPLDEASRLRLAQSFSDARTEISSGLSPNLSDEFHRFTPELDDPKSVSDAEIRIALAQLVGWLEGLYGGLQPMMFAQGAATGPQVPTPTSPGMTLMMAPGKPPGRGQSDESHTAPGQYL